MINFGRLHLAVAFCVLTCSVTAKADTIASAIEINRPVNLTKCLRALDACDGVVRKVTDQEILDAKSNNFLAALQEWKGRYGLASLDISTAHQRDMPPVRSSYPYTAERSRYSLTEVCTPVLAQPSTTFPASSTCSETARQVRSSAPR